MNLGHADLARQVHLESAMRASLRWPSEPIFEPCHVRLPRPAGLPRGTSPVGNRGDRKSTDPRYPLDLPLRYPLGQQPLDFPDPIRCNHSHPLRHAEIFAVFDREHRHQDSRQILYICIILAGPGRTIHTTGEVTKAGSRCPRRHKNRRTSRRTSHFSVMSCVLSRTESIAGLKQACGSQRVTIRSSGIGGQDADRRSGERYRSPAEWRRTPHARGGDS